MGEPSTVRRQNACRRTAIRDNFIEWAHNNYAFYQLGFRFYVFTTLSPNGCEASDGQGDGIRQRDRRSS
jgi:hypothetical protein